MNLQRDSNSSIVSICAAQVVGISVAIMSPFTVGGLIQGLRLSEAEAGTLITYELVVSGLVSLAVASLLARISLRTIALVGALGMLVANLISAQSGSMESLYMWRLIAGVANGLVYATANAASGRSKSPSLLFSLSWGTIYVVVTIVSLSISFLVTKLTHSLIFYCLAGIIVCMLPALWWLPAADGSNRTAGRSAGMLMVGATLLAGVAAIAFPMMAYYAFLERLASHVGAETHQAALIVALVAVGGIVGGFGAAPLSNRLGVIHPLLAIVILHALAIVLACNSSSLFLVTGGAILEGTLFIAMVPLILALASRVDNEGVWATAAGGVLTLSAAMGPVAGGTLIEWAGFPSVAWLNLALAIPGFFTFMWVHRRVARAKT